MGTPNGFLFLFSEIMLSFFHSKNLEKKLSKLQQVITSKIKRDASFVPVCSIRCYKDLGALSQSKSIV